MARREAPARKRMAIRSLDGAARHPISSPPPPFLLCHLLFLPATFVRFASAPSPKISGGGPRNKKRKKRASPAIRCIFLLCGLLVFEQS
jgi:hypothetical protein